MRWRTRRPPSCHQPWVSPVSSRTRAGSLKKIWQETAKTSGSPKPSSSGARKPGVHPHVAVQQHHDIVPGGAKARVRAAAETQVRGQGQQFHLRKRGAHEIGAAIGRAVVHHDDFVFRIAGQGGGDRGQVLLQQVPAVPVGDDHGGGGGPRPLACSGAPAPPAPVERTPENVGGGQRHRARRHQQRRQQQQGQRPKNAFQEGHVNWPGGPGPGPPCGPASPNGRRGTGPPGPPSGALPPATGEPRRSAPQVPFR